MYNILKVYGILRRENSKNSYCKLELTLFLLSITAIICLWLVKVYTELIEEQFWIRLIGHAPM